jgi:phage terminase large subunit-like protein
VDFSKYTVQEKLHLLDKLEKEKKALTSLFDEAKENDPYWWYEPSDGVVTKEGIEFLKKWLEPEDIPTHFDGLDVTFKSNARILGTFGGNQLGKTLANAIKAHAKVTGELPHKLKGIMPDWRLPKKWPVYGRVYGLSNDVIDEVIVPKFREWMPKSYLKDGVWEKSYSRQDRILRYYRKESKFIGQIKFMSCEKEVSKSQGASLSFAHFDEEPPKEFYDECVPRFIANNKKGIDIEFFMTPTNGLTWTYKTILKKNRVPGSHVECFKIATITNKYADLETLNKMMEDADRYEERKMRVLGEFISLSGLIYSGESAIEPRIHVIKPFHLPYNRYFIVRGIDPHLSKPTACVEVALDRAGFIYVVGCYKKNADTDKVKQDLAQRVLERRYRLGWSAYDKSLDYDIKALGDINIIDRLKRPPHSIPAMLPSEKFDGSIKAGIDTIKRYLKVNPVSKKPQLFFFDTPEVWELINEMQTLERDKGINEAKRGIKDRIKEGPKDLHAALRYIFQKPLEWIPSDGHSSVSGDTDKFIEERYI